MRCGTRLEANTVAQAYRVLADEGRLLLWRSRGAEVGARRTPWRPSGRCQTGFAMGLELVAAGWAFARARFLGTEVELDRWQF